MAIVGTLAILGFLLLVVELIFGGALGPLSIAPGVLGLICLWIAFWRGLAKGPAAVRLAVLCGFGSLVLFGFGIQPYFPSDVFLAGSAALIVLPETRILGLALGAMVLIAAVSTVTWHREYEHLPPGVALGTSTASLDDAGGVMPPAFASLRLGHHQ